MPGDTPMQPYPYKNESGELPAYDIPDPLILDQLEVTGLLTVGTTENNANEYINGDLTVTGTIYGNVVGSEIGPHFTATDATLQYRANNVGGGFDLVQTATLTPTFNLKNSADVTTSSNLNTGTVTASTSSSSQALISQANTLSSSTGESGFSAINDAGTTIDLLMSSSGNTNRGTIRTSSTAFGADIDTQGTGKTIRLMTNDAVRLTISDTGLVATSLQAPLGTITQNSGQFTTVSSSGFTGPIGSTTTNTGNFTTLTATGITGPIGGTTADPGSFSTITGPIGTITQNPGQFTTVTSTGFTGPIGATTPDPGTFSSITGPIGSFGTNTGEFTTITSTGITGPIGETTPDDGTFSSITGPIGSITANTGVFTSLSSTGITGPIGGTTPDPGTFSSITGPIGSTATNTGQFTTVNSTGFTGPIGSTTASSGNFSTITGPIGSVSTNTGQFTTVTSTGITGPIGGTTPDAGTFSSITGPIGSGTAHSGVFSSIQGPIGTVTPAAGSFTTGTFNNITGPIGQITPLPGTFSTLGLSGGIDINGDVTVTSTPITSYAVSRFEIPTISSTIPSSVIAIASTLLIAGAPEAGPGELPFPVSYGLEVIGGEITDVLDVTGDATVAGLFSVAGLTSLTGGSTITGPTTISGTFGVTGATNFTGSVGITGLMTSGSANVAGALVAEGDVTIEGFLSAEGAVNVTGVLTAEGALAAEGSVTIAGLLDANGAANVAGLLTAEGDMNVVGTLTAEGILSVDGAANIGGLLTAEGQLTVVGALVAGGTLDVVGLLTAEGAFTAEGAVNVGGLLAAEGDVTITGVLDANGESNFAGAVTAEGIMNVLGLLTAEGAITVLVGGIDVIAGDVTVVAGDVSVGAGSVNIGAGGVNAVGAGGIITGIDIIATTYLGFDGTIKALGSQNPTSFSGPTEVGALQVPNGGLNVKLDAWIGGDIHMTTGSTTYAGNVVFSGNCSGSGQFATSDTNNPASYTDSRSAIYCAGGAAIERDVQIGGKIFGNSTANSSSATDITASLSTTGGATVFKDLYVGGTIYGTVSGSSSISNITLTGTTGNDVQVDSTGNATSNTTATASIVTNGGVAVALDLYARNIYSVGTLSSESTTDPTHTGDNTASIYSAGGLSVTKSLYASKIISDNTVQANSLANAVSASSTSAAINTPGGVAIQQDLWVGGSVNGSIGLITPKPLSATVVTVTGTVPSSSPITGALVVGGGAGIGGSIHVGATGTPTYPTDPGASIVTAGGISVAKDISVGGSMSSVGNISTTGNIISSGNITTAGTLTGDSGLILNGTGSFFSIGPQSTPDIYFEYGVSNTMGSAGATLHFSTPLNGTDLVDITPTGSIVVHQGTVSAYQFIASSSPPLVVTSSTNVPNLNASSLSGATFSSPGPIGGTTPGTAVFTTSTSTLDKSGSPGTGWFTPTSGVWSRSALFTESAAGSSSIQIAPQGGPTQTAVYIETADYTNTNAANLHFTGPSGAQPMLTISPTVGTFGGQIVSGSSANATSSTGTTASIVTPGGISVTKDIFAANINADTQITSGYLKSTNATNSASPTDTAASTVIVGGLSVAKDVQAGNLFGYQVTSTLDKSGTPGTAWYVPSQGVWSTTALLTGAGSGSSSIGINPQVGPSATNVYFECADYTNTAAATINFTGPSGSPNILTMTPASSTFPNDLHVGGTLYAGAVVGTTSYTGVNAPYMQLTNTTGNELSMQSVNDSANRTGKGQTDIDTSASLYTLGGVSVAKALRAATISSEGVITNSSTGTNNAAYAFYSNTYGSMYFGIDGNGLNGPVNRAVWQTNGGINHFDVIVGGPTIASFDHTTGTTLNGGLTSTGSTVLNGSLNVNSTSGDLADLMQPSNTGFATVNVGNANSNYNCAQTSFNYLGGLGSTANYMQLGIKGAPQVQIDSSAGIETSGGITCGVLVASTSLYAGTVNGGVLSSGSWTPSLSISGWPGGNGIGYSTQYGTYSQIGNTVTYNFSLVYNSSIVTSGLGIYLKGFPTSVASFKTFIGSIGQGQFNITGQSGQKFLAYSSASNTVMQMVDYVGNYDSYAVGVNADQFFSGSFTISL